MIKILIVDDSINHRKNIIQILNALGYNKIYQASNGLMAIEMYKQYKPQIVYMDLAMPILDGINATQKIIHDYSKANIILMNSLSLIDDEEIRSAMLKNAISKGAKDYINKPVIKEDLQKTLKLYGRKKNFFC